VFWSLSANAADGSFREYGEVVQMRLGAQGIGAELVCDMLDIRDIESQDVKYRAWGQINNITIKNYSLGSGAEFDKALYYCGDNYGRFSLLRDDGCALSEKAACKIFGTADNVLGESVVIDGEAYIVEKLLYDDSTPVIFKINEENTRMKLDVLDIIPGGGSTVSVNEISMNFMISGDLVIYYSEVISFFSAAGAMLLWIAAIIGVVIIIRGVTKGLKIYIRRLAICGGLLLAAVCCYMFAGSPVYIPDSFIPTRWSEFEFWSNTFAHYTEALKYYFAMKTYAPDTVFRTYIMTVLICAFLSAGCLVAGLKNIDNSEKIKYTELLGKNS